MRTTRIGRVMYPSQGRAISSDGGPRRQHPRHGITRFEKAFAIFMQHDVIPVSKIILRRESIGRIPEPRCNEGQRNACDRHAPETQLCATASRPKE